MPENHPYREQDERDTRRRGYGRNNDRNYSSNSLDDAIDGLDDAIQDAVSFGSNIGSSVLASIADALNSVGDVGRKSGKKADRSFLKFRRRLDANLSNSFGGWMTMGVFGWILFGCFGVAAITMAILLSVSTMYSGVFPVEAEVSFQVLAPIFAVLTAGFGYMGYAGCHRANYVGRLRRYLRAAQDYTAPLSDIARTSMKSLKKVQQDLQKAVLDGKLPNACLDREMTTLYLDETLYHAPTPSAAPSPQPKTEAETAPAQETPAQQLRREGVAFLAYLRSCIGQLDKNADEELNQMLKTCGAILGFAHNHPDQIARLRRFRDYYMPTTRKLLDTALGLGDAEADNAQTIRRDITAILHTLNQAYAKLYDTLLQDVSMDVSSEIDTLETMLRQDGLTHDFASDFGPSQH